MFRLGFRLGTVPKAITASPCSGRAASLFELSFAMKHGISSSIASRSSLLPCRWDTSSAILRVTSGRYSTSCPYSASCRRQRANILNELARLRTHFSLW